MERRDILSGLALGTLATSFAAASPARANWGFVAPGPDAPKDFDKRMPVNKARAYEIMDREGLDAIVAMNPVNVFYLGNYIPYEMQKLRTISSFAIMPRDEKLPIFLVVSTPDLEFIATGDRDYPEVITYTGVRDWQPYLDHDKWSVEPPAPPIALPAHPESLSIREKQYADLVKRIGTRRSATPEWALVKALEECGLLKGKIAVDDMRIAEILKMLERTDVTCVPGDNTFRKIRLIKSEVELKHMRTIARINQDACMAMLGQLHVGMGKVDVDRIFMKEAADRGAKAVWIVSGSTGGFPDDVAKPGRAMIVDAVSQRNFYHGDFGRTFVFGEPSPEILERMRILKIGRDTALGMIKPGLKYSELRKAVGEAMDGSYRGGERIRFGVGPHSVGLQHTDQPYRDGLPFAVPDDITLQAGMTLTVDLPTIEMGWGGIHFEDLLKVTPTGVEPLATLSDPLVVL
jgi:Xaa-Pro aminopeptidase